MAIQKLLIRYILEPLAKIAERIPVKIRDAGFVAACLGIILQFFGKNSGIMQQRYLVFYCIGCICLGCMILCSLKSGLSPVKFRIWLIIPWMGIGGLMLLSGVLYNIDNLPEAMLFLVAYPVIFIVWNQTDGRKCIKLLFKSLEISFVIYLAISILFYPVTTLRYSGLFVNLNRAAGYLVLVAVCLLADCLWAEKITGALVRKVIFLGICVASLLYTSSRMGLLGIVLAAVTAVIIGLVRLGKKEKGYFFRNIGMIALSVLLFFNVTLYAFQYGNMAFRAACDYVEKLIPSESTGASDDGQDIGVNKDQNKEEQGPGFRPQDAAGVLGDRLNAKDQSVHQISTGRSAIWKRYFEQLNLFGHPDSGTVTFTYDGEQKVYHTTHMTILQVAYENGIIAGILYLVFNLSAGVYAVIYALRRKDDPMAMVPLLVSVAYGVYSLLASAGISFWYMITFFYYLVQFPLMCRESEDQSAEKQENLAGR